MNEPLFFLIQKIETIKARDSNIILRYLSIIGFMDYHAPDLKEAVVSYNL